MGGSNHGLLIGIAASAYWPLRKSQYVKAAGENSGKELEYLAVIRSAWGMEQFQPALRRAQKEATRATRAAWRLAHKQQHGYVNARAGISAAVGVVAVLAAVSVSPDLAALLIVFALRFGGHLSIIHYLAEFLSKINADAADLLEVMERPVKPRLEVDASKNILMQADGLSVAYKGQGDVANVITLSPVKCKGDETVLFTRENGGGKTTFFRVIMGMVSYAGSLKLWGKERRDFDIRHLVAHFSQVRIPLPVKVGDLFVDDHGQLDEQLMWRALEFAHVPVDFNLDQKHGELSGGQQQKIDVALVIYRALYAPEVRLIIIDEPTNNLDLASVEGLRLRIKEFIGEFDGCRLLTTHDSELQNILRRQGCTEVR